MDHIDDNDLSNVAGGTVIPYLIKKGDTLEKLAKTFHCTVDDICEWNKIENPNFIEVGQKLIFRF